MLRNLSSRLLFAFAFVILLSLGLSGVGTLFLLRDQQEDAAEERVGRLAEPLTIVAALLDEAEVDQMQIQALLVGYAESFDVRVLLVDESNRVVADSASALTGTSMADVLTAGRPVIRRGENEFRKASYSGEGEGWVLFDFPGESLELSSDRLLTLQSLIYSDPSALPPDTLQAQLAGLLEAPDVRRTLPLPPLRPVVAVEASEISAAWLDVIPRLAVAAVIAMLVSAAVAVLIARSITRPLGRITRAAQEMARGDYDQKLDLRGDDEVGRLAKAFNAMARQVSGSHQTMRDLLANVSHELKTPLTSIQGFSQAMEEGAISSPEEYREAGRIINEETQRMRRLVEDLIELSRLESGQAVVQREPVDLAELLRVCARRFDWQVRESGVTLGIEVAALPRPKGDARRLEQVFTNLIENAVRHTPGGGSVSVRAQAENGIVRVAVHNSGSYIPPEDLPRVFERFFQLDRNRARGSGGAGLGLAIAAEVVQVHGGAIRAESSPETGTQFVVTLPVAANGGGAR